MEIDAMFMRNPGSDFSRGARSFSGAVEKMTPAGTAEDDILCLQVHAHCREG
jgi:hypothetical protein